MKSHLSGVIAVLATSAAGAQQQAASPVRAITNVNVVDVTAGRILPARTVVIENGRIRSVEPSAAAPAGAQPIDGTGKYLIPGLWDVHVHLRHPIAPKLLMPQFIAYGITGVRDMGSDCDGPTDGKICLQQMREWQRQIEAGELLGPRLMALSSFPLNPPWDYQVTEAQARGVVRELKRRGVDLIKMYFRPSREAFGWFMDEAARQGLPVGGHIPLRVTALEASNAGLRSLEHARDFLFDCFPGSSEFRATARSQNPPLATMRAMIDEHEPATCDGIFRAFVRNGTWYVPTHVTRRMDAFADDSTFRNDPRSRYLPDELWKAWNADADRMVALDSTPEGRRVMRGFYTKGLEITKRAHTAGVNIALGTDAGDSYVFPGSGAHDELGELVKAGLTPAQALAAATIQAARFLGAEQDFGSIAAGKRADLVLLTANPLADIANVRRIDSVFFRDQVFSRGDLDQLLRTVEAVAADPGG